MNNLLSGVPIASTFPQPSQVEVQIRHIDQNSDVVSGIARMQYMTPFYNNYYTGTTAGAITISDVFIQNTAQNVAQQIVVAANQQINITNNSTHTMYPSFQDHTDALMPPKRRPAPREFNPFINASDLLEEFIGFLGEQGVRQSEVMGLPVELFIKWLVIRACEADEEEPNVTLALPAPKPQPRCISCQRFMPRATVLPLHDERCAQRYFAKQAA